jgi:hypothetical protein
MWKIDHSSDDERLRISIIMYTIMLMYIILVEKLVREVSVRISTIGAIIINIIY